MTTQKHPLLDYPEHEKIDYLSLVASIAAADGKVTDDEITQIREFCSQIGIGELGIGMIIAAIEDPSIIDVPNVLARLATTDLKFTLLTDMLFMACADGKFSPDERQEINKIAAELNISQKQITALNQYVTTVIKAQRADGKHADWKQVGAELAGVLASAGVPLGAVVVSGYMCGLSVQGISAALIALGLGLGLMPGIGVAISLGICSYFGVRWLFKKMVMVEEKKD